MNSNAENKQPGVLLPAILCMLLWASAFPGIKLGYRFFAIPAADIRGKMLFAGIRFALAGAFVLLFYARKNKAFLPPRGRQFWKIAGLGLGQTTVQYLFFYIGLAYCTGVKSALLQSMGTFFTILMAAAVYKSDRLNMGKLLGCALGLVGVAIVNLGAGGAGAEITLRGEGSLLISSLIAAAMSIVTKQLTQEKGLTTDQIAGWQLLVGGSVLLTVGALLGGTLPVVDWRGIAVLVYLALLSAAAFSIWTDVVRRSDVGRVSAYKFLIPVFGTVLSGLVLGENIFELKILVALVLVSIGIVLVNGGFSRKKTPQTGEK